MESLVNFVKSHPIAAGLITMLTLLLLFQGQTPPPSAASKVQQTQAQQIAKVQESLDLLSVADDQLRACIARVALERARITAPNSGAITDVSQLRQLYCANHRIDNLIGIEALTELEYLDISHNQISALAPLATLYNLQSLNLRHNPIDDVEVVRKLARLEKIQLPNLPEQDCQYLEDLLRGIDSNLASLRCYKHQSELGEKPLTKTTRPSETEIEREIERFERDY